MVKYSNSEQYLLTFIKTHRQEVMQMSIVNLAEAANVSTATIVRTMKKMGYGGYTDFRHSQLAAEKHDDAFAVLREADSKIRAVIQQNQEEVNQTIANLNIGTIEDGVQQLKDATQIDIFARGLSEMIGEEVNLKLQLAGKNSAFFHDPNIIITMAKRLHPGTVALFITLNGETPELVTAAKAVHKLGNPVITLTTNEHASIAQYSDILFIGYSANTSYFPNYEVRSRLPLQVISRILLDSFVVRSRQDE